MQDVVIPCQIFIVYVASLARIGLQSLFLQLVEYVRIPSEEYFEKSVLLKPRQGREYNNG